MKRFQNVWENLKTSFWFLPSIIVVISLILAFASLNLDQTFGSKFNRGFIKLFPGSAEAARGLLSTIATSLITAISIVFSITIIALQQASTQYSPRVLRTFTRDKGDQTVLGVFLGTFIYSVLILRSIRGAPESGSSFVPALSITIGLILTLLSVALLIYFISHIAKSIQVEQIINNTRRTLSNEIDKLFPDKADIISDVQVSIGKLFEQVSGGGQIRSIAAEKSGFVRLIDFEALKNVRSKRINAVMVAPETGDFIAKGQTIIQVSEHGSGEDDYEPHKLANAVILDKQRSIEQDPLFEINQLVDIALRAMSPSLNDPTTAKYCLFHLTDALAQLSSREFPSARRTYDDNPIVFIYNIPTWPKFVDAAYSQIRRIAEDNVHITGTIIEQLHKLALLIPEGNRWKPIELQLDQIKSNIDKQAFSANDKESLFEKVKITEEILNEHEKKIKAA